MCYVSRYFSDTRTEENCFLFCILKKNKESRSSHKYISAVGVFQGRRVLTRLILNSWVGNMMPTESMLLD